MITFLKKDLSIKYNLGDDLCTPDNYFSFNSQEERYIIGGGAYNLEKLKKRILKSKIENKTIIWGIGESLRDYSIKTVDYMPALAWSLRDSDFVNSILSFVPCVSCLNKKIILSAIQNNTLIYSNANHCRVGKLKIHSDDGVLKMKNDVSLETFLKTWAVSNKIITNSYHGIYWGLLSGREVCPIGYSTKFISLFKLFDLEFPKTNLYDPKQAENYNYSDLKFFRLSNHTRYLLKFQDLNYKFAESLKKFSIGVCPL